MIQTSYFAKYKKSDGISIARGTPKWFHGDQFPDLFPSWKLIKGNFSKKEYTRIYYEEVLSKLRPSGIAALLDGKTLLCWEKSGDFCHRRIVAEWLYNELGIIVKEYNYIETVGGKVHQQSKEDAKKQLNLF